MVTFILRGRKLINKYSADEITVYAAQASFFIIIAAFPFVMLLMTLIQFIPALTRSTLQSLLLSLVPDQADSLVFNMVEDLYSSSPGTVLSVTAAAALWSASRGMLSMARGLNRINGGAEKRNYFVTRFICAGYTLVFIAICIVSLLLLVLGTSIQELLNRMFPIVARVTNYIVNLRTLLALALLTTCFTCLYTYVPDKKLKWKTQLPGAVFSTVCWILFSFAFSIYFERYSRFSMYGSLTAIVLLMLWLYFCICILFLGAELNYFYGLELEKREPSSLRPL